MPSHADRSTRRRRSQHFDLGLGPPESGGLNGAADPLLPCHGSTDGGGCGESVGPDRRAVVRKISALIGVLSQVLVMLSDGASVETERASPD
jgi:hypothetical protein